MNGNEKHKTNLMLLYLKMYKSDGHARGAGLATRWETEKKEGRKKKKYQTLKKRDKT